MVFFNCNACGETLKRNKVEIHYRTKCRSCEVLSCVDCSKEFWGDDYKKHMTCISEEEKYSGSNYVAKPNKGQVKQDLWQKSITEAVEKHKNNSKMKDLLTRLIEHPNVPRKQKKFENFMRSSFGVKDTKCIGEVWKILSAADTNSNYKAEDTNGNTNGNSVNNSDSNPNNTAENKTNEINEADTEVKKLNKREKKEQRKLLHDKKEKKDVNKTNDVDNENSKKVKKKRKRKHEESEEDENENTDPDKNDSKRKRIEVQEEDENSVEFEEEKIKKRKIKFNWEQVILDVLNNKGEEIPLKKLRKKVLAEYASQGGCLESEDELCAKFMKKVTKNPKFKVHKERVKLAKPR